MAAVRQRPNKAKSKTTEVKPKASAKARPTSKAKPASKPSAKAPATRKPAAKKAAPAKAAPKTKAAPKAAAKTAAAKTKASNAKKTERAAVVRELDLHGFVPGTDSAIIAQTFVEGGESRVELTKTATEAIRKANGIETRHGTEKNVPSLVAGIIGRLVERGYTIESSYRIVPPADVQEAMKKEAASAKRRATRAKAKK